MHKNTKTATRITQFALRIVDHGLSTVILKADRSWGWLVTSVPYFVFPFETHTLSSSLSPFSSIFDRYSWPVEITEKIIISMI